jgi:hypothetical protein
MGPIDGALDLGTMQGAGGNLGDGLWARRLLRSCDREKHVLARDARSLVFGIVKYGAAHFLREREARVTPILASDAQRAVVPIDIAPLQGSDIPCAESETCQ